MFRKNVITILFPDVDTEPIAAKKAAASYERPEGTVWHDRPENNASPKKMVAMAKKIAANATGESHLFLTRSQELLYAFQIEIHKGNLTPENLRFFTIRPNGDLAPARLSEFGYFVSGEFDPDRIVRELIYQHSSLGMVKPPRRPGAAR